MDLIPGENFKKVIFLVIALRKFGHTQCRKLGISKTITAWSFKFGQLIEDND